jgi:anion-transporting  ArsA/GET3 family ATPase
MLADLGDFLQGFQGMYDGFKERAAAVHALFSRPEVGFVLVTSPSPTAIGEVLDFHERLHAESMPVAGLVANRVTPELWPPSEPLPGADELAAAASTAGADGRAIGARLAATLAEHQAMAAAERRALSRLFALVDVPRSVVPRLESDVHDLAGLARLAEQL